MLVLVLIVTAVDGIASPRPMSAEIPPSGGTIGRDDFNVLALPDSFNRVSRVHAAISFPAGYATISNVSVTLPLRVRDIDLAFRESVLISANDSIEIGPYVIHAQLVERSVDDAPVALQTETNFKQQTVHRAQIPAVRLSAGLRPIATEQAIQLPEHELPIAAKAIVASAPAASAERAPLADPLTAAFLAGARLPPDACGAGLTAETMHMIGACLRIVTAGAIDLLAARAITKFHVQADVTTFADQANNPFKFLPDADSVMSLALGKKMPGFLRADAAMRTTFADLRAHETGVIAGTRAAVVAALERFSPEMLTTQLAPETMLDRWFVSVKRAHLWDAYDAHYQAIARHAEQDFYGVFGEAFVAGYREEIQREAELAAVRKSAKTT